MSLTVIYVYKDSTEEAGAGVPHFHPVVKDRLRDKERTCFKNQASQTK